MPALPNANPPVPSDYCDLGAWWWNGNKQFNLASGQRLMFPEGDICYSPPTRGRGIIRNQMTFSFDLVSGQVTTGIGVTNPSEDENPMRPFVGVCYPQTTIPLHAGQRVMLIRIDIIDQSSMPSNIGSWSMNPGQNSGSGRAGYPSLAPMVTAVNGPAVISNVQIESVAHTV